MVKYVDDRWAATVTTYENKIRPLRIGGWFGVKAVYVRESEKERLN